MKLSVVAALFQSTNYIPEFHRQGKSAAP